MSVAASQALAPRAPRLPLVTWLYAVLFAVGFLFFVPHHVIPPSQAFYLHNAARLEALKEQAEPNSFRIVLLGDSRLRFAIHDDDAFAMAIEERLGRSVKSVRLVNNGAAFEDFAPLTADILDAGPDLVVIQEEQLARRRPFRTAPLRIREYVRWRLVGDGPWNPGDLDQAAMQNDNTCDPEPDSVHEHLRLVEASIARDRSGGAARQVASFVNAARASGVDVVFLAVPITTIGQQVLPDHTIETDYLTLAIGEDISDSFFCDAVHMHEGGRAIYSAWLADALADVLMDRLNGDRNDPTG